MADRVPPNPNDPPVAGPTGSPEKVGVYDRPSTATRGTGTTPDATGTANTTTEPAADNRTYYTTQASPIRWVVPALIVVLLILALLWWA